MASANVLRSEGQADVLNVDPRTSVSSRTKDRTSWRSRASILIRSRWTLAHVRGGARVCPAMHWRSLALCCCDQATCSTPSPKSGTLERIDILMMACPNASFADTERSIVTTCEHGKHAKSMLAGRQGLTPTRSLPDASRCGRNVPQCSCNGRARSWSATGSLCKVRSADLVRYRRFRQKRGVPLAQHCCGRRPDARSGRRTLAVSGRSDARP